ncbi:MAG: nucleotidyltransferase domain-containing protein [Pseudomonadota bacterium]
MVEKYADVEKAVSIYIAELRKHGINPQKVILFGSHAAGTATPLSDIDLVIVSADLARWSALERLEMLSRLTICVDAPLEVLGYTPEEIEKAGSDSILWGEIQKTGKVLVAA